MNSLILCTAATLNISQRRPEYGSGRGPGLSAGLSDGRQFDARLGILGKPGANGVSPRGWVIYAGLGQCQ